MINRTTPWVSIIGVFSPNKQVKTEFKRKGILNSKGMPSVVKSKIALSDSDIIYWYSVVGKRLLSYYGCTDNFNYLKQQVNWTLRYSLFATIGIKYKKSIHWAIYNFGLYPKVICKNKIIINFPSLE
jgi:hypothetical protein